MAEKPQSSLGPFPTKSIIFITYKDLGGYFSTLTHSTLLFVSHLLCIFKFFLAVDRLNGEMLSHTCHFYYFALHFFVYLLICNSSKTPHVQTLFQYS